MPPHISSRAYIQWLPDPASEPTSTLVLTSSQRRFVDIRVATTSSLDTDPSHVEWFFAGHSTSSVVDGKTHTQWHHWVDSTTTAPENVVDKGEMLAEDSDGLALEKGAMVNPATGRMTEYVEGWRNMEVGVVPALTRNQVREFIERLDVEGVVIENGDVGHGGEGGNSMDATRLCLVMQHENVARLSRGMAVRLGHLCQGVARLGDDFAFERWEWVAESGWSKTRSSGNLSMPCEVLNLLGENINADTKVKYGDGDDTVWKCVEAERF